MKQFGLFVKVENDSKQNYQSFKAVIKEDVYTPIGDINFHVTAYGASEQEALDSLKELVTEFITHLEKNKHETSSLRSE